MMNYQLGQQTQWPQQPEQPQNWNTPTQGWSSQPLNMPSTRQFKGPLFQSLPSRQPQQSLYDLPPVTSYIPPQQKSLQPQKQFRQAKIKQVKPGFFRKKIEVPVWTLILTVGIIGILIAVIGITVIRSKGSLPETGKGQSSTPSSSSVKSTSTSIPTAIPTKVSTSIATHTPLSTTPSPNVASPTSPPPTGQLTVGGTIIANGIACTLVSVQPIQGDASNTPQPGDEYIVVHIKRVNKSGKAVDYNPLGFRIHSGTANITNMNFSAPQSYTANNLLSSGQLAIGGTVEGDLIFQVPVGDHSAELTWQPTYSSNPDDYAWNLWL